MKSTFSRALAGFVLLTAAISLLAMVALWAVQTFGGGAWWASLLVVIVALVSEVSVYGSTLHGPIYDWIREPARIAEDERNAQRAAERERILRKEGLPPSK